MLIAVRIGIWCGAVFDKRAQIPIYYIMNKIWDWKKKKTVT